MLTLVYIEDLEFEKIFRQIANQLSRILVPVLLFEDLEEDLRRNQQRRKEVMTETDIIVIVDDKVRNIRDYVVFYLNK